MPPRKEPPPPAVDWLATRRPTPAEWEIARKVSAQVVALLGGAKSVSPAIVGQTAFLATLSALSEAASRPTEPPVVEGELE